MSRNSKKKILMLPGVCLTLWLRCLWAADGLDTWTLRTNSVYGTNWLFSIAFGNNKLVAVGGDPTPFGTGGAGVIVTSSDGRNWTQVWVSSSAKLRHVTYGGGVFLAGAAGAGGVFASPDGNSWAPSRGVNASAGIAYGNYLFLAASGANVYRSTDAVTWSSNPVPGFELSLRYLAFGNGQFVAAGGMHGDGVMTSTNGSTWRGRSPARVSSISYGVDGFVAVGNSGTIITSLDATTWVKRDSGITNNLLGVGYGGGVYVAVGSGGTILTSTDATTWTRRTSGVTNDLTALAYGNGRFMVVGASATILESGPVMHLGQFQQLPNGAVQFTLSGPAGQLVELQTSPDLVNWSALTGLKLTEPSATFVIISPTNFSQRFYRTVVP